MLGTPPALILSQDQTLKLKLSTPLSENQTRLTRAPVDDLALHVVQFVKLMSGSQPPSVGELHPLTSDCTAPPADTRRVVVTRRLAALRHELCLHVLSSFQRTGISHDDPRPVFRVRGNLAILLTDSSLVNPCAPLFLRFRFQPSQHQSLAMRGHALIRTPESGWGLRA